MAAINRIVCMHVSASIKLTCKNCGPVHMQINTEIFLFSLVDIKNFGETKLHLHPTGQTSRKRSWKRTYI
jgi:hypothetical protein